jgi:hypothetical protein
MCGLRGPRRGSFRSAALPDLELRRGSGRGRRLPLRMSVRWSSLRRGRRRRKRRCFICTTASGRSGGTILVTGEGVHPQHGQWLSPTSQAGLPLSPLLPSKPPDDALLAVVLVKLFDDRQLAVTPDLIEYLLPRIERSFAGAQAVVANLDRMALARRRPVNVRLAMEFLHHPKQIVSSGTLSGHWFAGFQAAAFCHRFGLLSGDAGSPLRKRAC